MAVNSLTPAYIPPPSQGGMIEILLVEDNPGDVRLLMEALNTGRPVKLVKSLSVVGDGIEAMDYLHRQGKHAGAVRPDLILLDLNLPKKDGREVLAEIKEDPSLKRIPVVVLTTSNAKQDILKAYDLHANCYITKPVDLEHFFNLVRAIEDFWLRVVKLPSE
jgi:two-component system, chemotaxis family, response regulator Rcp1